MTIKEIATAGHNNAVKNGFYFDDSEQAIKDKLNEEIGELETAIYCKDYKPFPHTEHLDDDAFLFLFERFIKNTVGGELSDIIITALSGAVELGIDIESYLSAGNRYNSLRKY